MSLFQSALQKEQCASPLVEHPSHTLPSAKNSLEIQCLSKLFQVFSKSINTNFAK